MTQQIAAPRSTVPVWSTSVNRSAPSQMGAPIASASVAATTAASSAQDTIRAALGRNGAVSGRPWPAPASGTVGHTRQAWMGVTRMARAPMS